VVALGDPDPRVAGHGLARLAAAGLEVVVGVGAEAARDGLAGHLSRVNRGRPWVRLKLAVSADGRLGRRDRGRVAITGPLARAHVHAMRAEADAILVGIGTALVDDPDLTVRLPGLAAASPIRVVLDTGARLPLDGRLAQSAHDVPVRLLVGERAGAERRRALAALGVEVVAIPEGLDGRIDPEAALSVLAASGIGTLMVEGGAEIAAVLVERDLVDEVHLFVGETVVGPEGVRLPATLEAALDSETARFAAVERRTVGPDRLTVYHRKRPPDAP
jgi:diaminohydroxyphosphoribosylaminopyrimidine deaminase/5-amino-6-(5-phosphoribosylamino)uracil reductase